MLKDQIFDFGDKNNSQIIYLQKLSKTSNSLYNLIVIITIIVIASLPFIHINLSSSAPATIESTLLRESITAPFPGKISVLKITNNEAVRKGDVILEINDIQTANELDVTRKRLMVVRQYLHDIEVLHNSSLTKKKPLLYTAQYQTQYANLLEQRNEMASTYDNALMNLNRYTALFKKKIVSSSEFEQYDLQYKQAKSKLNLVETQNNSQWQTDQYQYNQELTNLLIRENQLKETSRNSKIIAHVSGTGYKEDGVQEGAYVQAGQKVAQIYPNNDLISVCYVSPKDIAYIKMGQKIKMQVDAFNYYEWGMLEGKVFEISKEVDLVNSMPIYVVKCKLNNSFLYLRSGFKGAIIKGMTGRANFYLSSRTAWQLIFTKINDWFDPKKNN